MNITIVFLSYKFIYSQPNIKLLKMTKAEIVNKISSNLGLEKNEVLATLENFMDEVKNSLSEGENVYLRGFGSFIVKKRAEKNTIVDQDGATYEATIEAIIDKETAPTTAPMILPIPPRTTRDINIPIHSQCFAGKKENKKLTSEPDAPAILQPRAKEIRQTILTFTPTSSALVLF